MSLSEEPKDANQMYFKKILARLQYPFALLIPAELLNIDFQSHVIETLYGHATTPSWTKRIY